MRSQFVERDGGFKTHYLEWATTQKATLPVICIHGNLLNAYMYRWLGEKLAAGKWGISRQVIAIDMRGCGDSDMPPAGYTMEHYASDIDAVMQHAGIDKAHFIAFSRGVHCALQFAWEHPGRVAGFVAGDYPLQANALTEEWAQKVTSAYIECQSWEELIATLSPDGTLTRETAETIADVMFREQDGWIRKHYPKQLPTLMQTESHDVDLAAGLANIDGPVLLMRGIPAEGSVINDEQAAAYNQFHADVRVEQISGTGHDVFFPNPQTENIMKKFFTKQI